ncbi:oxidoreductaseshort chain dehydrogenase/reductase family protein [Aphelenchoides avenae]|nr:oxidoreductaseshort chain dehydrogenase/reductase family protein [Aphelenchus avenae]
MVLCLLAYAVALLAAVYYAVTTIGGKFKIPGASRKAVLITGCDTGFGRLAVLKCLREGMVVFAGCLHAKSVKELEDSASEAGGSLVAFELDVTSDVSVASAKQLVESRVSKHNGLHAVINNAGTARVGFNDWIDVDEYKSMMDVDLFGTVRVNQAFLPLLKKSR